MDEAPIMVDDETDIRRQCLEGALRFFEAGDAELSQAEQATDVAGLFEHYVMNGATTTIIVVRNGIERTVR